MSVLALIEEAISDHGVGDDAERIRRMLGDDRTLVDTITVGDRHRDAMRALREAGEGASMRGWDGYRAAPLQSGVIERAESLLRSLPTEFPLPEIGIDPGGAVFLEWQVEPRWVFSMTIDAHGVVSYAGLYGKSKAHGREHCLDALPGPVVQGLSRLFARRAEESRPH